MPMHWFILVCLYSWKTDGILFILKLPEHFYIENICGIIKVKIVWGLKTWELKNYLRIMLEYMKFQNLSYPDNYTAGYNNM